MNYEIADHCGRVETAIVRIRTWREIDCKLIGYRISTRGCEGAGALIIVRQRGATGRRIEWHVFVHIDNETMHNAVTA